MRRPPGDQAGAVDRMAECPAHLQSDFVILEGFLAVRRHQHPNARENVAMKLLRELRVLLKSR